MHKCTANRIICRIFMFKNLKRNSMEDIFEEFGEIGFPSMYEITKLVYELKQNDIKTKTL